ncbi:hypothetical protein V4F30_17030 [Rhodococcus sp. IITD102]|uniref:hypothetical protein n=1 Tax=Rhodococcus sp. IITD102 TaxID=3119531 RepID=UPI002FC30822
MTNHEPVNLESIARQKGLELMTSGPNPTDPAVTYHLYKRHRGADEPELVAAHLPHDEAVRFVDDYEPEA